MSPFHESRPPFSASLEGSRLCGERRRTLEPVREGAVVVQDFDGVAVKDPEEHHRGKH